MKQVHKQIVNSQILQLLKNPEYRSFIFSVALSQMAINMTNLVAIFLIYYLTSSNFLVSLLILSFMLPQIFFSFIGGVVADLKDKKKILFYGNIIRAIIFFILVFFTKSLVFIYFSSFLVSIISQFYITAETPMIPKLVQKKILTTANSIFGVSLFGSILIGYLLAGPLIERFGRSNVFLFIGTLFAVSSYFIYKIPDQYFFVKNIANRSREKFTKSIFSELHKTVSLLIKTSKVTGPFLLLTFSQVIILMLATIVPGYANKILEVKEEALSLLIFGPASLGMMISSFLIGGVWSKKNRSTLMTIGLIISGIVLCLFPFTTKIVARQMVITLNSFLPHILEITAIHLAVTLSFFIGFSNAMIFVPSQTILQESIPESFRSKVYGLMFSMIGILSFIPILITGRLADDLGVGSSMIILGLAITILGLARSILNFLKKYLNI